MYTPTPVPTSADELPSYLVRELQSLSRALISKQPFIQLQTVNVAPPKPQEGMVVLCDGTHWNAGSGAGFYGYRNGAWHLLG